MVFASITGTEMLSSKENGKCVYMLAKEKLLLYIFAIVLLIPMPASADTREYKLKASFFEKFIQLTEWPAESQMSDISKPFIISVIGENPFGKILDKMYQKGTIKNKKVEIRYIYSLDKIPGSHLLFISKSMQYEISRILSVSRDKPILTVSEVKGFSKKGGHINFYITDKETLHFEINESMVRESGLRMHLLLIEIAKIVKQ
jgi:YfiR/HmsC-like